MCEERANSLAPVIPFAPYACYSSDEREQFCSREGRLTSGSHGIPGTGQSSTSGASILHLGDERRSR